MTIGKFYQSGDWKGEKHVPVIHLPENIKKGEYFDIKVLIGEEIPHPNEFEHYIAWIKVYFHADGAKFPVEIGTVNFSAHGEFDLYTDYNATLRFKTEKPGKVYATSYCNIHGLWENSSELKIEE